MDKLHIVANFVRGSHGIQVTIDIFLLLGFLFISSRLLLLLYFLLARQIAHAGKGKCFAITLFIAVGYAYLRSDRFGFPVSYAAPCAAVMALFAIFYFGDVPFWRALLITPLFIALTGGLLFGSFALVDRYIPDRWTLARQFSFAEEAIQGAIDPNTPGMKIKGKFHEAWTGLVSLFGGEDGQRLQGQLDAGLSVLANSRELATNQLIMMENINAYADIEARTGATLVKSDGKLSTEDFLSAFDELRALQKEKQNAPPPDVGEAAEYLWANLTPTGGPGNVNVYNLADSLAKVTVGLAIARTNGADLSEVSESAYQGMGQLMAIASGMNQTNASSSSAAVGPALPKPAIDVGALLALASGVAGESMPRVGPALPEKPNVAASIGAGLLLATKTNSPISRIASDASRWLSEEKVAPVKDTRAASVVDLATAMALMSGVPRQQVQGGSKILLAANHNDRLASLASPISQALSLSIRPDTLPSQKDWQSLRRVQAAVKAATPAQGTASSKSAAKNGAATDNKKKVVYRKPVYLKTPSELKINGVMSTGAASGYVLCNGEVVRIGRSISVKQADGTTVRWKLEVIEGGQPGWSKAIGEKGTITLEVGQSSAAHSD